MYWKLELTKKHIDELTDQIAELRARRKKLLGDQKRLQDGLEAQKELRQKSQQKVVAVTRDINSQEAKIRQLKEKDKGTNAEKKTE